MATERRPAQPAAPETEQAGVSESAALGTQCDHSKPESLSPVDFYQRITKRPDVRAILSHLAANQP